jgi:hypothetical protein
MFELIGISAKGTGQVIFQASTEVKGQGVITSALKPSFRDFNAVKTEMNSGPERWSG